jgi:uncharacterized repeat protein (TIGR03803 family)
MSFKRFFACLLVGWGAVASSAAALAQAGGVTVLHAFTGNDGANIVSGVVVNSVGDIFGAARNGGGTNCTDYWSNGAIGGCGTVYELTPPPAPGQPWGFQAIYTFTGGADGAFPANLTLGTNGELYGMTGNGGPGAVNGSGGQGVLFKLVPPKGRQTTWKEEVLYNLCSQANCSDGAVGGGELLLSSKTLFGTTPYGGASGNGTVFKYDLPTGRFTSLYSFKGNAAGDGANPFDGVVADGSGNLYGTTYAGGGTSCLNGIGCGTVYELASINHGLRYQEFILHAASTLRATLSMAPTQPVIWP